MRLREQEIVSSMYGGAALEEFMRVLHGEADEVTLASAASRFAETVGFRWFTYLSLGGLQPEALSTDPAVWSDHYFANRFELIDPVIQACSTVSGEPFRWGMNLADRPTAAAGRRVFDDAASFGIVSGVTIPLRGPGDRTALFTLSTDERSAALDLREQEVLMLVQMSGLQLHAQLSSRVARFMPGPRPMSLTEQQTACLSATAFGLTAKETAREQDISFRTVEHHIKEVKGRLGARSQAHAVALALRQKLIK